MGRRLRAVVRRSSIRGSDGLLLFTHKATRGIVTIREIDHTGDTGIEVTAGFLPSLFEAAASGLFALLVDSDTVSDEEVRQVVIQSSDLDDLMVRWLSELNYLHLTERLLLKHFEVKEIDEVHLSAEVWGEPYSPDRHQILTEIKAVTYHELKVERRNDTWFARIIFDL